MKKNGIILCLCLLLSSCGLFNRGKTQEVAKPRYHKGWYKNHVYHRKIGVGRVQVKLFEKQGTKTVRMK